MFQVTCDYKFENGACVPTRVHTVVVSTQHSEKVINIRKNLSKKIAPSKQNYHRIQKNMTKPRTTDAQANEGSPFFN